MEQLSFKSESFDAITSGFGFGYAGQEQGVEAERPRLDDLERAVCSEESVSQYQGWFEKNGFAVEKTTDHDGVDPAPYCWILKGYREP